ncbi:hypothetical protein L484_004770 [Morus notabilis]|uniref:Uncharacterized protein n=1 Tax=Morus notabilis TaxID=981085 RepID=W9RAV9_9ROSA|nr:hypothetical protein L484_004770 [Morus notabilis]
MFKEMRFQAMPREKRLCPIFTESRLLEIKKVFIESRLHKTKCLRSRDREPLGEEPKKERPQQIDKHSIKRRDIPLKCHVAATTVTVPRSLGRTLIRSCHSSKWYPLMTEMLVGLPRSPLTLHAFNACHMSKKLPRCAIVGVVGALVLLEAVFAPEGRIRSTV